MLQEAFRLHTQGRLAEAERAYSALIEREPGNFQALHLLGVLMLQTGQSERAIALLRRSLAIEPRQPLAERDLGNAYQGLGRLEAALESYDRALLLKPELSEVHNNRGIALGALGRQDEAVTSYAKAIALKPDYAQAYNNRGTALSSLKRFREAIADFDKAIALKPDYLKAYNNRGIALAELNRLAEALSDHDRALALNHSEADTHVKRAALLVRLGRLQEALESYDRAIALQPLFADAHDGRGTVLLLMKRPKEALAASDQALALNPMVATFHNNRGSALAALDRHQEALESFAQALAIDPSSPTALSNQAAALSKLDRSKEALARVERALQTMPNLAQAHINRGNILADLARYDDALASFDEALVLNPQSADAHFGRATALLIQGRFAEAWPAYEWRKKRVAPEAFHALGKPEWTGREELQNKSLFIEAEQGLGDTIQFCRYAPLLADKGAKVAMTVRSGQERFLKTLDPRIEIRESPPDDFDYHVALLSLPLAFGTTLATIPSRVPYLRADPERSDHWRRKIGAHGYKIGIVWQGSAYSGSRSFRLAQASSLANLKDVRLISLQKGQGLEQLEALPGEMAVERLDGEYQAGDFAETASAIEALDLVISCDTAMVHVAGALGKPVWVALADAADWRWLLGRQDSPWYPSARLFRQEHHGDWPGVFDKMRAALEDLLAGQRLSRGNFR